MKKDEKRLKSPWKKQRILKKEDIPEQEQIIDMAMEFTNLKHRALFIIAYLTAGRISEIVKRNFLYKNNYLTEKVLNEKTGLEVMRIVRNENESPMIESRDKVELNYPGILRRNIIFKNKQGKDVMIVSMQNRKSPDFKRKNIPIPIAQEAELIRLLREYIDNLQPNDPLFDFTISKAEKIISKINMNPHFLRDIRLTHMVTIYDFNAFHLAKFAGWKNADPAEKYVRLGVTDLIAKY